MAQDPTQQQYQQYGDDQYDDQYYNDGDDDDGWIWDDDTQQWVEDPNWVDPYADQYDDQPLNDQTNNNNDNQQINNNKQQINNQLPKSSKKQITQSTSSSLPKSSIPPSLNTKTTPTSSSTAGSGLSSGLSRPDDAMRQIQKETAKKQKQSSKIDETHIPRVQISNKVTEYLSEPKLDQLPPGSRAAYIAKDLGNATPRHIRMTLYNIPLSGDTADKCSLALAAVIQPIANIGLEELDIPRVNMGTDGPIRCIGCRGYMNPHVLWINDSKKWICNLCQLVNETPQWYRNHLDGKYQRRDKHIKPELNRGSIDYIAPTNLRKQMKAYKPAYFFIIDVSCVAYQRGLIQLTVDTIRNSIYELRRQFINDNDDDKDNNDNDNDDRNCILRVGFLTYDSKIHFHGLSSGALHVISEVSDPFVSLPTSELLIPLMDDVKYLKWDKLLSRIPSLFESNALIASSSSKSCFGAALYTATSVLNDCGGKIIAQQTTLPSIGIGSLKFRDAVELHGSDRERDLYVSSNSFYPSLTNKCAQQFISVDIFCCAASSFCDLASVGEMSRKTGGQIYYYSNFNVTKDGDTFEKDMRRNILRTTVFRSIMAIRASKGLEVVDYFGNFFLTENQEIQLPCVTSDTTLAVSIRHYEKLNSGNTKSNTSNPLPAQIESNRNKNASIQVAMLYLSIEGEVYIRIHTISLPIVRRIADVFRCVDMDTVLNVSLKQCAQELISPISSNMTVSAARKSLVSACIDILFVYRRYCASNNAQRQLVLPEALKLLPLFTLGLLKNPLLSDGIQIDERAYHISYALHMPCYQSLTYIHPYLYPMHKLSSRECVVSSHGRVLLPAAIRLKCDVLKQNGLYVMDTGRKIYIVCGHDLPKNLFKQAFIQKNTNTKIIKTKNIKIKNKTTNTLQIELKTDYDDNNINDLGYRLSLILDELQYDKPYMLNIEILLLPNTNDNNTILTMDQHEFLKHLIEDASRTPQQSKYNKNNNNKNIKNTAIMSYVDFLVFIHKEIQKKFVDL